MLCQYFTGIVLDFAECHGFKAACALKAKAKASDPAEQVEDSHTFAPVSSARDLKQLQLRNDECLDDRGQS